MKTEAHKRIVFQELPAALSIQLLRFSNGGKNVKKFVEYPMSVKVKEVISEMEDVEIMSEEQYQLVAVLFPTKAKLSTLVTTQHAFFVMVNGIMSMTHKFQRSYSKKSRGIYFDVRERDKQED